MYFSLIYPIEGQEREAAFARLEGPYAEHQWLWRFFPAPEGTPRDFLFRSMDTGHGCRFYVVSAREPQHVEAAWQVRSKPYMPRLSVGQQLHFDVRVNPVVARQRDGRSRRDDVVMSRKKQLLAERGLRRWRDWQGPDRPAEYDLVNETCWQWLCEAAEGEFSRGAKAGFRVARESLRADGYQQHNAVAKGVRFSTVDLSGLLEVTDNDAFCRTLGSGIGRGRAFGCGLLLVQPV